MTTEQRAEFEETVAAWKRGYTLSWTDMRRRLAEAEETAEMLGEAVVLLLGDLPPPCRDSDCPKRRCIAKRLLAGLVDVTPSEEDSE